jgi:hypothetical protein
MPAPVVATGRAFGGGGSARSAGGNCGFSKSYDTGWAEIDEITRSTASREPGRVFPVFIYARKWDKVFLLPRASSPPKEIAKAAQTFVCKIF